jgi:uncharacterized membrane protein
MTRYVDGLGRPGQRYAPATEAEARHGRPPAAEFRYGWPTGIAVGLVAITNILVISGLQLPFLEPALGFWFLVFHPAYLLYTNSVWGRTSVGERVGYSLTATLLLLMLAGLFLNTVLPVIGIGRPLDPVPVLALGDALTLGLYAFRHKFPADPGWLDDFRGFGREEGRVLTGGGLSVLLAVLGANRLNNGVGDQVSIAALVAIVITLVLMLAWHGRMRDGTISIALYLLAAALLLMTSLRGWYVTGHDIQSEYHVFQLTAAHGRWNIASYRDPYNACLSITILPTELAQVAHVYGPYIYKVFFQLIFAVCPVLVYSLARRYWSAPIGILAVVYFIGFPTFFTDMPFLNRQEMAFLFVCVAFLAVTNPEWDQRRRRLVFFGSALGVELSHYSTMYIFLGTLLLGCTAGLAAGLVQRLRHASDGPPGRGAPWATMSRTVGFGSVLLLVVLVFAWNGLATRTAAGAVSTAESAVSGLIGSGGARSSDVSYGLLSGKEASPQALLNADYRAALKERSGSADGTYVPASVVARYPTPVVTEPSLPLTGAGLLLSDARIPVAGLNGLIRQAAARGEQLFAVVGIISFIVVRRLRRQIGREFFFLCVGSLGTVAVITVLPDLSVDYGVLRAFQESLILIAPMLVSGSLIIFSPLRGRWAPAMAAVVSIGIFVSTCGLMPQLLGGYPAQLNLNNSGQYYEVYYMQPQEVAAVDWLENKPGTITDGVQGSYAPNRYEFTSPRYVNGQESVTDIYPPLVRQSSWVILGYSTLQTGRATTTYDGDLLTYVYPVAFLQENKNLVYDNGSTEIYK